MPVILSEAKDLSGFSLPATAEILRCAQNDKCEWIPALAAAPVAAGLSRHRWRRKAASTPCFKLQISELKPVTQNSEIIRNS
jgi:hypothetical protein